MIQSHIILVRTVSPWGYFRIQLIIEDGRYVGHAEQYPYDELKWCMERTKNPLGLRICHWAYWNDVALGRQGPAPKNARWFEEEYDFDPENWPIIPWDQLSVHSSHNGDDADLTDPKLQAQFNFVKKLTRDYGLSDAQGRKLHIFGRVSLINHLFPMFGLVNNWN